MTNQNKDTSKLTYWENIPNQFRPPSYQIKKSDQNHQYKNQNDNYDQTDENENENDNNNDNGSENDSENDNKEQDQEEDLLFNLFQENSDDSINNENNDNFNTIASSSSSSSSSSSAYLEHAIIGTQTYHLLPPPDTGTLFAHKVWSGSKLLASYINDNPHLVTQKTTIEFGSGTALPSLVCLHQKSKMSIITDYPEECLLIALKETVGWNWDCIHANIIKNEYNGDDDTDTAGAAVAVAVDVAVAGDNDCKMESKLLSQIMCHRVGVFGHEWGKNIQEVKNFAIQLMSTMNMKGKDIPDGQNHTSKKKGNENENDDKNDDDINKSNKNKNHNCNNYNNYNNNKGDDTNNVDTNNFYFDVAILSECLWMHRTHEDLAKSLHELLHPVHGIAIITYAHHIPGCEEMDDAFFQICAEKYGMVTEHILTKGMEYMWDKSKTIDIQLKIIKRGL